MYSLTTLRLFGVGCLVSIALFAAPARADDEHVASIHASSATHDTGVALTATGAAFLIASLPAAAGTTLALLESAQPSGGPTTGALAIGAIVLAGCTVIGLSTLIPGIVLMNESGPNVRTDGVVRDAHATPPLPSYTYVPLVSASF